MDINGAWKKTCQVLLGDEIGDLERYRGYLLKYVQPTATRKSALSGKPVCVPSAEPYPAGSRFISKEEEAEYAAWLSKQTAMGINEIKDLDSAVSALGEKLYFCGDVVLGNSSNVEKSTDVTNSHYIYESWLIRDGAKYVAFTNNMRGSEYCFGSADGGAVSFLIKGYDPFMDTRCFEVLRSKPLFDSYYVANLQGCNNCMFSFNLRNASYRIGNLQLGKDKYNSLKQKLLEDIRDTFKSRKEVPTLIDIIGQGTGKVLLPRMENAPGKPEAVPMRHAAQNMAPIQSAFDNTCMVVFGKRLGDVRDFGPWLGEHVSGVVPVKSCASGAGFYSPELGFYLPISKRMLTLEESLALGSKSVGAQELDRLSLANASMLLASISPTTPEVIVGSNLNIIDCVDYQDSANSYMGSHVFFAKNSAYTFFGRSSENVFGVDKVLYSNNCIRCRNSTNLARCFEVTDSYSCQDSYFCHNSENLSNCSFCFNAKNLKYAIGNLEIGREKYMKLKAALLAEITGELEKNKSLRLGVYGAAAGRKPR
ncbi:MAG: hypothetical protein WC506_02265 [Candidatus Micrarchaeia archaeon]